ELPAAVDDFLGAALQLGVIALHGVEVELGDVRARAHRRGRAAAHADQEPRAAELDKERARGELALRAMRGVDVADAAREHDRLVITAVAMLEGTEIAAEVRAAELVVVRGGADRRLEHDLERGCDVRGLALRLRLPRMLVPGNAQMGSRVADEPRLRLRAPAGRALVADLTACAGRRARKGRDRRRVIVR